MATTAKRGRTVKVSKGRVVSTRRATKLILLVEGVPHELAPFLDDPEGRSITEWLHGLTPPRGRQFAVFIRGTRSGPNPHYCDKCESSDCPHIAALDRVGML